jgi:hypothetical protein
VWALSLSVALASGACGTTATIIRFDETRIVGHITGSSHGAVSIVDEGGRERHVARGQIRSISHPGGGAMGGGAALLGYGILNIAVGASKCDEKGGAFCAGVFTPAAAGLAMIIWGAVVNIDSRNKAGETSPSDDNEYGPGSGIEPPSAGSRPQASALAPPPSARPAPATWSASAPAPGAEPTVESRPSPPPVPAVRQQVDSESD